MRETLIISWVLKNTRSRATRHERPHGQPSGCTKHKRRSGEFVANKLRQINFPTWSGASAASSFSLPLVSTAPPGAASVRAGITTLGSGFPSSSAAASSSTTGSEVGALSLPCRDCYILFQDTWISNRKRRRQRQVLSPSVRAGSITKVSPGSLSPQTQERGSLDFEASDHYITTDQSPREISVCTRRLPGSKAGTPGNLGMRRPDLW